MDACPEGWHLPNDMEWENLMSAVGGKNNAGVMLKSSGDEWEYYHASVQGSDAFGFTGLPAGIRNSDGTFDSESYYASFWISKEQMDIASYSANLFYDLANLKVSMGADKQSARSVRCVQD